MEKDTHPTNDPSGSKATHPTNDPSGSKATHDSSGSKPTSLDLNSQNTPMPVPVDIQHVDSQSTLNEHIDSDATIMTAQLAILMQAWPKLNTLDEMTHLSAHLTKLLMARRQLCLRPTNKAEAGEDEDAVITPI